MIAGWLESRDAAAEPVAKWLVDASRARQTLVTTLLLLAGLHRDVLAGEPATADLAHYFPTAGGKRQPDDPDIEDVLHQAILSRRRSLAPFIQTATVQTNETGRGLCWLLPVLSAGWQNIQLVDLGANAGLNLVADQRAYRLQPAMDETTLLDLGMAPPVQFRTICRGDLQALDMLRDRPSPAIAGRFGCDLSPFRLASKKDELILKSFTWGDQVARLERLEEGIKAYHKVQRSGTPVNLHPADLPDDLGRFLQRHVPQQPAIPVVIYNTWMTSYLRDKGRLMFAHIDRWANHRWTDQYSLDAQHSPGLGERPVLWLQWEPARDGSHPPEYGWCAWTADLWQGQDHRRWQLGWVHPHGGEAQFGPGLRDWIKESVDAT